MTSVEYIDTDMPWEQWICCLSASLRVEELERYERYMLAGGDKKKWQWQFQPQEVSRSGDVAQKIIGNWTQFGQKPVVGSLDEAVKMGVAKTAWKMGDQLVDEDGKPIEVPRGYVFVPKPTRPV